MAYEYTDNFTEVDLTLTGAGLNNTTYNEFASYRVPFKQEIYVGNGSLVLGNDTRGTFSATVQNSASADLDGSVRIALVDANQFDSKPLWNKRAADVKAGVKVGKGGDTGLPEARKPFVQEREYISLQGKTASGSFTVDTTKLDIVLPVTIRAL